MAEKRKRVAFRSKRSSGSQSSVIRFNVAEETTETVVDNVLASNSKSYVTPPGKVPTSAAKQLVTNSEDEESRVEAKRESETTVRSKNTTYAPKQIVPLFPESVDDLDLFDGQRTTLRDSESTEMKLALSSEASSPREGSSEPIESFSEDSSRLTDSVPEAVDEGRRVDTSPDVDIADTLTSSQLDRLHARSDDFSERDIEVPLKEANREDHETMHQGGESDNISLSSDQDQENVCIDGGPKDATKFVSEHPLAFSVEPSSDDTEDDVEITKESEATFRIVDDHYKQTPATATPPRARKMAGNGNIPPARPPPPKHILTNKIPNSCELEDELKYDDEIKDVVKASSEVSYWSFEFQCLIMFSMLIFIFYLTNTSVYLSGVFDGVVWVFLAACTLLYHNIRQDVESYRSRAPSLKPPLPMVSKKTRDAMVPRWCIEADFTAIRVYNGPLLHQPSTTTKVHVIMDGHSIHISAVKDTQMSFHRLVDEEYGDDDGERVTNTKVLDLRDATVQLAPSDLSRKQRFSKKFPMKVTFKYSVPDICFSLSLRHTHLVHHKCGHSHGDEDRVLYLFAPTSHDKEMWFWRLQSACNVSDSESANLTTLPQFENYVNYMCRLIPDAGSRPAPSKRATPGQSSRKKRRQQQQAQRLNDHRAQDVSADVKHVEPSTIDWFNAFIGRLFWDAWNERYLRERLHLKWQHKLNKTKRPSFMRPLTITDLSLGSHLPTVTNAYRPYVNDRGIWVELDLDYKEGTFCITLETSLQFVPGEEKDETVHTDGITLGGIIHLSHDDVAIHAKSKVKKREVDSDIDSGAEDDEDRTTIDESSLIVAPAPPEPKAKSESKDTESPAAAQESESKSALWRIADKVLQSRIVRKAVQTRLGQRVTEKVNNISLVLTIEITSLRGRLLVNMSPPPTDRIWYGFKAMPEMTMIPTPKVGSKMFNYHKVTEWIDRKLRKEFEKRLVFPNMEDLVIPILESGIDQSEHIVAVET